MNAARRERPGFYLPDFCGAQSVLAVVLIAELVALFLTLARIGISAQFWTDLARTSLFLLWAGLGTAAALCTARGALSRLDVQRGSLLALLLMLGVTAAVTEGAWWLAASAQRLLGVEMDPLGA
ncbi:MAG: sensor histidine kinase, partial [Gammaproteobacteria bacterium]|nr:sensor histidine kinase [Gammaproteobacteria bacterium]